uniref:Uncharacterized protein n=1 Tax=Bracon brevicornis TaxID=1563983 RepID=A0A6V7LCS9_9HYME
MSFDSDSPQQPQYKPHRSSKHQQQNHGSYSDAMNHHNYPKPDVTSRESHCINHRNGQPCIQQPPMEEEDIQDDYTPVPVKQLIQEFEKTCRPILQYKQISPKVAPSVQQPMDDISRFFEGTSSNKEELRNGQKYARNNKNDRANGKMAGHMHNGKLTAMNGGEASNEKILVINGNSVSKGKTMNTSGHQIVNGQTTNENIMINGQMTNGNQMINPLQMMNSNHQLKDSRTIIVPRYTYDSTDDEIDDSFGESSSSDNCQNYYGPSPGFSSGNRASTMSDYDYRRQLLDCAGDQLFTPSDFRGPDEKFFDTEAAPENQTKALNFAMIASQDDIVEQIKQLRRTPVVENLVPGPSPDRSKLGDFVPELGKLLDGLLLPLVALFY